MAFANKLGSLLRQSVTRHTGSSASASMPSIFNVVRYMSSSKLFIGGLSWGGVDDSSLREAFSDFGEVIEARVILDRDSGRSRGFGFVSFTNTDEATAAMSAMDGEEIQGRSVRVNYATERTGGFGGGGGGYGGGSGERRGGNQLLHHHSERGRVHGIPAIGSGETNCELLRESKDVGVTVGRLLCKNPANKTSKINTKLL